MPAVLPEHGLSQAADSHSLLRYPWFWMVLACGVLALGYLTLNFTWNVFDEGFVAKGGEVVLQGKLLIRDFLTLYGPAQFYLLAGMYGAFGVQLLVLRIWSVTILGLFGVAIYLASARLSGNSRASGVTALAGSLLVLLYAIPPSGYPMVPAAALLIAAAIPLQRFAATGKLEPLAMASALVGCSALFRWDQGIFGLGALAGALAFWLAREGLPRPSRASFRVVAWAFLPAMGIIAMVYVPLIISAGADLFVEDVLIHSLRDFEAYRGIHFVRPQIWGILRALEQGRPGHALLQSIPLVLMSLTLCLVTATLVRACFRARSPASSREIFDDGTLTAAVFLALVVLGLLNQMRIRPEVSRSMLVAAAATPLCAFWWRLCVPRTGARLRTAALSALALAIAVLVAGAASAGYDLAWRRERVVTESPYARFIRNPVHEPQYNALLAYVRQHTQPGERIFSGVTDHQVLFINDAMVYFLTGRDGPTRFYEMDPGLANTPQAQEHIVAALDKMPVRLLVLWDLKSTEDNLSSRPNGVDTLDRYIRLKYRLRATFGSYQVWMREEDALAKPP